MTIDALKLYRYYAKKCKDYDTRIKSECVKDCSKGSTEDYPFIERMLKLNGLTPEGERLCKESYPVRLKLKQLNDYIDNIDEPQTKDMFELVFKKGKTYRAAAFAIGGGISESGVRMRIKRYLQEN